MNPDIVHTNNSTEDIVGPEWVPSELTHLKSYQKGNRWLCLNPSVPAWFVTTRVGTLILQLADGRRSLKALRDLLQAHDIPLEIPELVNFFKKACIARMYASPSEKSIRWNQRKLTAMHLHLTNRCNLKCAYCFRKSHPHIPLRRTAEDFVSMLACLKPFTSGRFEVTFTGGEPLMFPGFTEVVTASARHGYTNILLTNGTLINEHLANVIAQNFSKVYISLDGPNENVHSTTRGANNFKKALRGTRLLAKRNAKVSAKMTVTRANIVHADELRKALPEEVPLEFTPLLPMGRGRKLSHLFIDDEAYLGLSRGSICDKGEPLTTPYLPGARSRGCEAGVSNISIDDTGDVYPCHLFHLERFRLGNVFSNSFSDMFYSEKLKQYVQSMDIENNNDNCRECALKFLCAGGCKANALCATGDHRGVDLFCKYLKNSIVDDLFKQCSKRIA